MMWGAGGGSIGNRRGGEAKKEGEKGGGGILPGCDGETNEDDGGLEKGGKSIDRSRQSSPNLSNTASKAMSATSRF